MTTKRTPLTTALHVPIDSYTETPFIDTLPNLPIPNKKLKTSSTTSTTPSTTSTTSSTPSTTAYRSVETLEETDDEPYTINWITAGVDTEWITTTPSTTTTTTPHWIPVWPTDPTPRNTIVENDPEEWLTQLG